MNVNSDKALTGAVIGAGIAVHRELGPGVDEALYEQALSVQLGKEGISHVCQRPLPVSYKGAILDCGYRLDVLVENRLILELKALELILAIHEAQLLTYLQVAKRELGLLLNFDVPVLKEGIKRMVLSIARKSNPQTASDQRSHPSLQSFDLLSGEILAAAVEVHRELGPGLLRSTYEECLCHELQLRGLPFERHRTISLRFGERELRGVAEIPVLVAGRVPVSCLSVAKLSKLHCARLLARVRQGGWPYGLVLNFNVCSMARGVHRVVHSANGGEHRRDATDAEISRA
jgi:GxxExxY protein